MEFLKTSYVINMLNNLDISEQKINEIYEKSFLCKIFNIFNFSKKIENITEKSLILKHFDKIILFLISILFIFATFCTSGKIGAVVITAFLATIFQKMFLKKEKCELTSMDVPVIVYVAIMALSVCFSSFFHPALKGFFKVLIYFSAYLTFSNILKNHPKRILYLMILLSGIVSLEAFYAVYQNFAGVEALATWQDITNVNPEDVMSRVYGTLKPLNPNLLAGYLVGGFPFVLSSFFVFLNRKNIKIASIFLIGTFAVMAAIFFTGSRGSYLALASMMLCIIAFSGHFIWKDIKNNKLLKKIWILSISLGFVLLLGVILTSSSLMHRIESIFAFRDDSSNSFRFNVYLSSLRMFFDNFIIGIGPGNCAYRLVYGLYMKTGFDALSAYNVLLEISVESGILGLFAFLWILALSFIKGFKAVYKDILLENKIIIAACLTGIVGLMVHGLFDTVFFRPQVNLIFWLIIAFLAIMTTEKYLNKHEKDETK